MQHKKQTDLIWVSIEDILNTAEILLDKEGIDVFALEKAFIHLGYSDKSDEGKALLDGLIDYRFVIVSGEGSKATLQLTDLAVRFVGDEWTVRNSDKSGGDLSGMWSEMGSYF